MLRELPRARLANLPTPLHEAKHFSKVIGGPKILFKREDATGPALGGQKARMLEYPFGDAVAKGCDVIVDIGAETGTLSPHVAAAANKLGMDHILVCLKRHEKELTGTGLLLNLLDPEIIQTPWDYLEEIAQVEQKKDEIIDKLQKQGRHPYEIGFFSRPLGVVGFFYCVQEIMQQLKEMGETAQYLYVAHATGTTHGGLLLGAKYFHAPFKVVGTLTIPQLGEKEDRMLATAEESNAAAKLLNADISIEPTEIILHDEYIGEYGATKESIEAIRLVAKTEGVFLDPYYTGKAMAAMLDDIRHGKLTAKDTVIFYHSGGAPLIFYYPKELRVENRTSIEVLYR